MGMYDHATLGSWLQKCSYQRFSDKTFLHVIAELPANDLPGIQRGAARAVMSEVQAAFG